MHNSCVLDGEANIMTMASLGIKPSAEVELILKQSEFGAISQAKRAKFQPEMMDLTLPSELGRHHYHNDDEVVVGNYRLK